MNKRAWAPLGHHPKPSASPAKHETGKRPPAVVQAKAAVPPQRKAAPPAPPVYRPQPLPKVLQRKEAGGQKPPAPQAVRGPAAPPVYRPQPPPRVMQAKPNGARKLEGAGARPPAAPPRGPAGGPPRVGPSAREQRPSPQARPPLRPPLANAPAPPRPAPPRSAAAKPGAPANVMQLMRGGVIQRASYSVDLRLDDTADDSNREIKQVVVTRDTANEGGRGGKDGGHKTGAVIYKTKWALIVHAGMKVGQAAKAFNSDPTVGKLNNTIDTSNGVPVDSLRSALERQINAELKESEKIELEDASDNRKKGAMVRPVVTGLVKLQQEKIDSGSLNKKEKKRREELEAVLATTSADIYNEDNTLIVRDKLEAYRDDLYEKRKDTPLYLNSPTHIKPSSPVVTATARKLHPNITIEPKSQATPLKSNTNKSKLPSIVPSPTPSSTATPVKSNTNNSAASNQSKLPTITKQSNPTTNKKGTG